MAWFRRSKEPVSDTTAALDAIKAAEFSLVALQWKGKTVFCRLRELSQIQIMSCGQFSLIETDEWKREAEKQQFDWKRYIEYADTNVKLCKLALVVPTYDEIFDLVGKQGFWQEAMHRFEEINKKIRDMPRGPFRKELEQYRDSLRVSYDLLLPDDFMRGVVDYTLGISKSDIKKVTTELLLNAAILAEKGHKAPHDYITPGGQFTEFNKTDIDATALMVYHQWKEDNRPRGK